MRGKIVLKVEGVALEDEKKRLTCEIGRLLGIRKIEHEIHFDGPRLDRIKVTIVEVSSGLVGGLVEAIGSAFSEANLRSPLIGAQSIALQAQTFKPGISGM